MTDLKLAQAFGNRGSKACSCRPNFSRYNSFTAVPSNSQALRARWKLGDRRRQSPQSLRSGLPSTKGKAQCLQKGLFSGRKRFAHSVHRLSDFSSHFPQHSQLGGAATAIHALQRKHSKRSPKSGFRTRGSCWFRSFPELWESRESAEGSARCLPADPRDEAWPVSMPLR